jgi:hypothetical protein
VGCDMHLSVHTATKHSISSTTQTEAYVTAAASLALHHVGTHTHSLLRTRSLHRDQSFTS